MTRAIRNGQVFDLYFLGKKCRTQEQAEDKRMSRQHLCIAITQAVEDAKGMAGAAPLDGLDLRNAPPAPRPAPREDDGLIRT
ncbi:hypothetical protein [Azospirillum rugosum]|uniref:Uncharacterized protein n=1 Tax=Azospirillum rugosum TaxID=416170 RepID=A0ABS4SNH5_9PROT|nr:hypothetical protein [Azospirillum rugosum]MBP2294114.1 hypothetical protein [Azospirillum rugosum]MDQ0527497.1 hypothetical protein [Azospirillum rugosum]